jgi:hypothetical protein
MNIDERATWLANDINESGMAELSELGIFALANVLRVQFHQVEKTAAAELAELRQEREKIIEQNNRFLQWHAEQGQTITELRAQVAELERAIIELASVAEQEKRWNCWKPKDDKERRVAEANWMDLTNAIRASRRLAARLEKDGER